MRLLVILFRGFMPFSVSPLPLLRLPASYEVKGSFSQLNSPYRIRTRAEKPQRQAEYSPNIRNLLDFLWREQIGGTFWQQPDLYEKREILVVLPPLLAEAKRFWAAIIKSLDKESGVTRFSALRVLFPSFPRHYMARHTRQEWNYWARRLDALGVAICKAPCHPHHLIACSVSEASEGGKLFSYALEDYACLAFAAGKTVFLPDWERAATVQNKVDDHFSTLRGPEAEAVLARFLLEETQYFSPYTGQRCSAEEIMHCLALFKRIWAENSPIMACWGMAWWKRRRIAEFFRRPDGGVPAFCRTLVGAIAYAKRSEAEKEGSALAIWASYVTPDIVRKVEEAGLHLVRVEDGFVRSFGLGSGFLPPSSIVADWRGLYVDARHQSDLEYILSHTEFDHKITQRAGRVIKRLIEARISKYAAGRPRSGSEGNEVVLRETLPPEVKTVILVPGQVANDLSVRLGGGRIKTNLALLQEVRRRNPDAWIIYRPHPDVEAGHRPGALSEEVVLRYASSLHLKGEMSALLEQVDEVHTLTSLAGFEGLLRGRQIVTYGAPFYAGWGLGTHYGPDLPRRRRKLSLEELVAGALLIYPRYVDPVTGVPCSLEHLLDCLQDPALWTPNPVMRLRSFQGRARRAIGRLLERRVRSLE